MNQILLALLAIVFGVGGTLLYFYGVNWLIDGFLPDKVNEKGEVILSRQNTREAIRPWVFIAPALILLGIYLVFPAGWTLLLSFFDQTGRRFVGLDNYIWAINDAGFQQAVANNLLWLIIVPFASTAFGLVVAVLADRVRWESLAKSFIFLPMAISFVGASIIWRFVYAYRGDDQTQIGLLNAMLVATGAEPQSFITNSPMNNFFLMIILIWIQTGFAMVLLSAALKGVPEETLEAARIDGANEIQIFFRVMIPQIMGTITVVMTTIIIVVLKVFDIVYTMTGGQFNTEVLANYMDNLMFRNVNFARSSTVAIAIMIATIPFMIWNIIRFRNEEKMR